MELQEINYHCTKQIFVFVMKNFSDQIALPISSEKFMIGEAEEPNWKLHFYPRGSNFLAKSMSMFLEYFGEQPAHCSWIFSVEDKNSDIRYFSKTMMALFNKGNPKHGFKCFINRDDLFNKQKHLLEDSELRVVFEVEMSEKLKVFNERDRNECKLKKLLNQGSFTDAELSVDEKVFPIHKVIVAVKSDYFFKIFSENTQQTKFEITDVTEANMQYIIDFIYDRELDWTQIDIPSLFNAAKKFEMGALLTISSNKMEAKIVKESKELSLKQILQFLEIFVENDYVTAVQACVALIYQGDFQKLNKLVEWKSLLQAQPKLLYHFIGFDSSEIDDEENVFVSQNDILNKTKLCKDFENLFLSEKHADVVFEAEGQHLNVHKAIICGRSAVFDSMFSHDLQESKENIVRIEDTKFEVLRELVRFMYSDRIENIEKVAVQLYSAADKYELKDLKDLCKRHLINNVTADNVIEVLVLTETHYDELRELNEVAREFLIRNVTKLCLEDLSWLASNKFEIANSIISEIHSRSYIRLIQKITLDLDYSSDSSCLEA